ncbi:MAG: Spy/CpxP family protein refolding chaperone [Lentisphaeria bacterium]|nr:Spy/CpxP family protein refolding chaperone [Lentisphaeria bacterium]
MKSTLFLSALLSFSVSIYTHADEGTQRGKKGGKRAHFADLNLPEDQLAVLKEIMKQSMSEKKDIMRSEGSLEDKQAQIDAINAEYDPQIEAIIGTEALAQMQEKRAQVQARMKERFALMRELTPEQQEQLKSVMKAKREEMKAIRKGELEKADKQKEMEAVNTKYDPQVEAIVGAEKFAEMKSKREQRQMKREAKADKTQE